MKKGEKVLITCGDRSVVGTIYIASPNSVSLIVEFEAMLDGHAGRMPLLMDENGVYHALITGTPVKVERSQ